jgi:Tfp pilus assembly protein PilZ
VTVVTNNGAAPENRFGGLSVWPMRPRHWLGMIPIQSGRTSLQDSCIQMRFESPAALRDEFEKNISNRGIFIASEESFQVRAAIDVEVVLTYVDDSEVAISLRGEVVHCIPVEMAASGAVPGIAVQFDDSAKDLADAFEPLLGQAPAPIPEKERKGPQRRGSKRGAVRVPVRIMPAMSPPFEATSRDLSGTGVLLSMKNTPLPIGEIVRTGLWHPSGDPSVEIDGQVVREVRNKSGQIAAVAIAFDRIQAADQRVVEVIDALRQAGHRSRLGGISGSIVDLGLASLLQMLGSSATQGTIVVERDGAQGWIAFADGQFLGAELGLISGQAALAVMLDWGDGRFQFEATADKKLIESAERCSLEGAILKAACVLDEGDRAKDEDDVANEADVSADQQTTFDVDLEQAEIALSSLDKTEQAVFELAKTGMPLEKLSAIIPESEAEVQAALDSLVELGVLLPR